MVSREPDEEVIEVSRAHYDSMWREVEKYEQPHAADAILAALGDDDSWPCPFCQHVHDAPCVGSVPLGEDETPIRGDIAALKKVASWANFDPVGSALEALANGLLGLPPDNLARVYRCPRCGEFEVRYLSGEPELFVVWVERQGHSASATASHSPMSWPPD
jgi:hypothetical protein